MSETDHGHPPEGTISTFVWGPLLLLDGTPAPAFAPTHIVDALDYSGLNIGHLSSDMLITDFGEAFYMGHVPKAWGTAASFSAPELLFGYQPSCAVDLWALGCLIFELLTFRILIPTILGSEQEALAMAIETVGALPETWQNSYYDKVNALGLRNPDKKHRWFEEPNPTNSYLGLKFSGNYQDSRRISTPHFSTFWRAF